ncbi:TonB-dependent receptor [Sphingosinicella rhizophila]|uniref:TonB-dependent receptor n=1 Tax=Sphingosinicella rhizophila TaxID=3050082 RepID=A0ABU3QA41_9SPHN|nr:TonB-dependent receptor [Sphingosinicella sp. GR2756]MDT9600262.1 TonB-dependent receptor [Sphingosinicella sp. GR2756]
MIVAAPASAADQAIAFNLPAQSLEASLKTVSSRTGANIVFAPATVAGHKARALKGSFTAGQAVSRLIAGSGLSAAPNADGTILVRPAKVRNSSATAQFQANAPQTDNLALAGQDEGQASDGDAGVSPDIVVTANKRSERLRDVPAAVTALTADTLTQLNAVRFEDYAGQVPGLNIVQERPGNVQINLRGVTTGATQPYATVAIYVDETPFGSSTSVAAGSVLTPDLDTFDLQRIEVLRGPQGTLYGAGALGGLVKFVTIEPNAQEFSGQIRLDGSTTEGGGDGYGVRAAFNLPLVRDKLAARISLYNRRDPGFIDDDGRGVHDVNYTEVTGGRLSLSWRPTQDFSVRGTVTVQDLKSGGTPVEEVDLDVVNSRILGPTYGPYQQRRLFSEPSKIEYRIYDLTAKWDLGAVNLVSATSYSTLDNVTDADISGAILPFIPFFPDLAGFPIAGAKNPTITRQEKFTQELRLSSSLGRALEWQLGAFYTHETASNQGLLYGVDQSGETIAGLALLFNTRVSSRYDEYAVFGNIDYHFSDRFDVRLGARYSTNAQDVDDLSSGLLNSGVVVSSERDAEDDSFTFLVNPRFRINDDMMIYANISSGYRPGGGNTQPPIGPGFTPVPDTFQPASLINYELGFKSSWFDRRLNLELAAFLIDWRKAQIPTQSTTTYVKTAPARIRGVEASFSAIPAEGLTLSGQFTYLDAELRTDEPGFGGFRGDRLSYVPKWSGALNADYERQLFDRVSGFVGATYRYTDDRLSDFSIFGLPPSPLPRLTIPSYDVIDLRAGINRDEWSLSFFVKNLADKRGINRINTLSPLGSNASMIQPRTFTLSLATRF